MRKVINEIMFNRLKRHEKFLAYWLRTYVLTYLLIYLLKSLYPGRV